MASNEKAQKEAYENERKIAESLFTVACTGPVEKLKDFVSKNVDNNYNTALQYKDANQRTILHFAAHSGQFEVCKILLQEINFDLKVFTKDIDGLTPFGLAVRGGHVKIVKLFAEVKGFLDKFKEMEITATAMDKAASSGNFSCFKYLFELGGNTLLKKTFEHGTVLHSAIFSSIKPNSEATEIITLLLETEPTLKNIPDGEGATPIMIAVGIDSGELVQYLLSQKVDLSIRTKTQNNIYHAAATSSSVNICKYLIKVCDKTIEYVKEPNLDGKTPLDLVVVRGEQSIFDLFVSQDSQTTPLIFIESKRNLKSKDKVYLKEATNLAETVLKESEELKQKGNTKLKQSLLKEAMKEYSKSVDILQIASEKLDMIDRQIFFPANLEMLKLRRFQVDRSFAKVLNNRSLCFLNLKNHKKAIEDAKKAVKLDELNLKGFFRLGKAYEEEKEFADAAQAYWNGYNLKNNAQAQVEEKDYKSLFDLFQQAVEKGKSLERRKKKNKQYDFEIPIEVPLDDFGQSFHTLTLKFNKDDNEIQVATKFITENSLHPSLVERIAKHIYETKLEK